MSPLLHLAKRGLLFMLCSLWMLSSFAQNVSECYKPITGFGVQVNPIRNSLICLDCDRTGINNVTDANKNNFADLSQFVSLINGNGITVKQTSFDYPAGYYAGFVVALGNDLNVNVLNAISISTFKDDVLQQTATGASLKATPILGGSTGRAYLYFETNQSFDEVRFTFSSLASVLSEVRVYYAMAFDPNCGTIENNAICDDAIQGNGTSVTYNGGLVCALCSLLNSNNLVDADKNNYATLTMPAAALSTVSVGVLDEKNIYPAGNKAGFVIAPDLANTILDANLLNSITIETYLFGTLQESQTFNSGSGGLLTVSALSFNSVQKTKIGFTTTKNFNEVKLRVNQPVGVTLGALRIFYAFEEPAGCGDCHEALTSDRSNPYTVTIVTGSSWTTAGGLTLNIPILPDVTIAGTIQDQGNVVNSSLADYATYTPPVIDLGLNVIGLTSSASFKLTVDNSPTGDAGPLFPAGTFGGFVIQKEGGLLDVNLLSAITIKLYNGTTEVGSKTGAALLNAGVLSGTAGKSFVGFQSAAAFNRIQIIIDNGLLYAGGFLGSSYRIYYAFVIGDIDNDGTPDCIDACPSGDNSIDTDGDGTPDACDDCTGNLFKSPTKDTDADGVADACDADSDNDGIADVVEDANNDGDPTNDDFDGDGVPNYQDLDSDNDGINDINESGIDAATVATLDADNDGVIDASVPKGSNGMANAVETNDNSNASINYTLKNTDGDGNPDYLDLDSDNDGINDIIESGHPGLIDANNDGVVDGPDADGDGIQDSADGNDAVFGDANNPAVKDTDADNVPDFRDLDSDNDGINDIIESGHPGLIDANNDGVVDGPDADADGIMDSADGNDAAFGDADEMAPRDTDGDSIPDFRDLDSDNDGINDIIESGHPGLIDANNDGVVDGPDADGDGIQDSADGNDAVFGDAGEIAPRDTDGDSVPDFRDLDSDNDGIGDLVESGHPGLIDADNDGVVDGPDADGDGIQDSADGNDNLFGDAATPAPKDTDADGTPDYRDLDSDNDGIKDIIEGGHGFLDQDGDGRVDNPSDPDGDGIANNGGLDTKPDEFGGINSPAVPDLTPSTRVSSSGFNVAEQTERTIVIDVSEIAGATTNNAAVPIQVRVLKSDNFIYTFDAASASASANVPAATPVNNADWDLTTNSGTVLVFTLKPGKNIAASGLSSIAVKLKVVAGASKGTDNFNVSIVAGSGTETNFSNNLVNRILNIF
ncbi:hypothetical protein [Lacibacter sp. H407]|uniref:hypothetical protein n=1 Tax=Lacibacter sp. H407 TaxID=3133423 RepID=UPI0030BFDF73